MLFTENCRKRNRANVEQKNGKIRPKIKGKVKNIRKIEKIRYQLEPNIPYSEIWECDSSPMN